MKYCYILTVYCTWKLNPIMSFQTNYCSIQSIRITVEYHRQIIDGSYISSIKLLSNDIFGRIEVYPIRFKARFPSCAIIFFCQAFKV